MKGRSLFQDRLGEAIAPAHVTLVDDPTEPARLHRDRHRRRGARRAAQHAHRRRRAAAVRALVVLGAGGPARRRTGNAVRGGFKGTPGVGCLALQLVPGVRDQAELVADVDDGVLIQSVRASTAGVNPISGDFSTGAAGLMIANGEVGAPVREFTIASTLQRMLLDIAEVGSDVDWLPMRAAGVSLVIHDVTMSGA